MTGFSLLEAIVALALIASVGMAIYGWINSSLIAVGRVREVVERGVLERNALEWIKTINPAQAEEGQQRIGDLWIEWRAIPQHPLKDATGYPGGSGLYQVGYYRIDVRAGWDEGEASSFSLHQIGYHQARPFEFPF
jgi:general secretion pathway protein I